MQRNINNNGHAPRKRGYWRWPIIIVAILTVHIGIMVTAMAITLRNPGESAVIPNYYERETNYDSFKAAEVASARLGWAATAEQIDHPDAMGFAQVRFTLTDKAGKAIPNVHLAIHCFHWSHADQAADLTLRSTSPTDFTASLPQKYAGFWQFEVSARRGNDTYLQTLTQYIN